MCSEVVWLYPFLLHLSLWLWSRPMEQREGGVKYSSTFCFSPILWFFHPLKQGSGDAAAPWGWQHHSCLLWGIPMCKGSPWRKEVEVSIRCTAWAAQGKSLGKRNYPSALIWFSHCGKTIFCFAVVAGGSGGFLGFRDLNTSLVWEKGWIIAFLSGFSSLDQVYFIFDFLFNRHLRGILGKH